MDVWWLLFALLCAFFEATRVAVSKRALQRVNEHTVNWAMRAFSLPFVVIPLFFVGLPAVKAGFWHVAIAVIPLAVLANVLYMRAIKVSPLSLTIPFLSFTPLFLLLTSPIILHEFPSALGILGIVLIVGGSYVLNIEKGSLIGPFRAIWIQRGSLLMLIVAFIFSITSNVDKVAVLRSSPFFWVFVFNFLMAAAFFPLMLAKSKNAFREIRANYRSLFGVGLLNGLTLLFQMIAIKMALVSYVISVKRLSVLFSVVYGFLLFREKDVKKRLAGAALMFFGVVVITLYS